MNFFSSLLCSDAPFNSMFARVLLLPASGADYKLTDGHGSYNIVKHERCLFHKLKNLAKKDKRLKKMHPDDARHHLMEIYRLLREAEESRLAEKYPEFIQDGHFTGAMTTNAMEGGNWRIKFELRACYENLESFYARCILILLSDSLYNFRNGEPKTSFAYRESNFSFATVMEFEESARMAANEIREIMDRALTRADSFWSGEGLCDGIANI